MHAARDCADKVCHGDSCIDKGKSGCIDTCLKGAPILLEDLDVNVDLRARVQASSDNGLER